LWGFAFALKSVFYGDSKWPSSLPSGFAALRD
jgi:hypothetical protein